RFQMQHTGTPWAQRGGAWDAVQVVPQFSGGYSPPALVLAFLLSGLVLLALWGRLTESGSTELNWHSRPETRPMAAVLVLCPLLAAVGSWISGSAFVARYTSVVFPLLIVLAAVGLSAMRAGLPRTIALTLACTLGLALSLDEARQPRTPATTMARML